MARPDVELDPTPGERAGPDHQLSPGPANEARRGGGRGRGAQGEPGIVDLVRSLADDVGTLVRQEIDLAKMEMARTARRLVADSAWIASGAAIAALGVLCLIVAMALGLGALLGSYWLGTLITGLFLVLLGGGLAFKGARDLQKETLAPTHTKMSLREDAQWARDRARDFKQGLAKE
jgi:hypothetical protein